MRLGVGVGRGRPEEIIARARRLESAGVDVLWTGENYGYDAVSIMGFLAAVTSRVQIGSSILQTYIRTPTLVAMSAAGVDALSDGRCILGLGTSGPGVVEGFHGVPFDAPVGRTRETIEICRKAWARQEPLAYQGAAYQIPLPPGQGIGVGRPLRLLDHPVRDRIPIYVAAMGPRNVELTAELAEGWLPGWFWPEKAAEVWGPALAAGQARRDPALPPLDVVAGATVAIGDDLGDLRDRARGPLAFYIGAMGPRGHNFYNDLAVRLGYEKEARQIQELFLSGKRDEATALVPQDLVDGTTLIGPAGLVRDRLEAYREAGVTTLNASVTGPDPEHTLDQLRAWTA
jgi:F420-dependent oxidoreductase-like protein